jgi:autotransporter translocation and assembly factor TamB
MKRVVRFPLYLLLAVLVLVAAVAYVYFFTTLPETEINNWLSGFSGKKLGFDITFEKVNRDIWNGLKLEGVRISRPGGSPLPLAYISHLDLEYKPEDLIRGRYHFNSLAIDSIYARVPEEGFAFPSSGQNSAGKPSNFSISIDKIHLGTAALDLKDGDYVALDSLQASLSFKKGDLDLRLASLAGRWPERDIGLNSLAGRVFSEGDGYRFDSLNADLGGSHLALSGTVGRSFTNDLDLRLIATPVDFDDISKIFDASLTGVLNGDLAIQGSLGDIRGRADLDGTFMDKPFENISCGYSFSDKILRLTDASGKIVRAPFKGSAEFNFGVRPETYSMTGTVRHLDLREIGPQLKTDFTGAIHIKGQGFKENNMAMSLDAKLDSVRIENYYFDQVSGSVSFDLKTIHFLPGFMARYKNTYLTGSGYLEYAGNLDIAGNADFQDLTNFTGQTFIKELGGRGKAQFHITGPTIDFNVDGSFESDSAWTYGLSPAHMSVNADLKSFITHPVGEVTGSWKGGTIYSIPSDSGYFQAAVSGDMVFIDTAAVNGPLGGLNMIARYDGTLLPPVFTVDTLYGLAASNRFFSRQPLIFNIHPTDTEFKSFVLGLGNGTINVNGSVANDLKLGLDVEATGFQIQPIVSQFYTDRRLTGIWWGQAKLRGDFANPQMDINLNVDSLAVNDTVLGNLTAPLVYRDKYIHTDSTRLVSNHGEYYFSGDLPVDLSFAQVENRFPENPINLNLAAFGNRLLLSEIFIPNIERLETDFNLQMRLGGTYSNPTVSGQGSLTEGTLKILDLVDPLTNFRAYLRMENETIYIDSAMADVHGGEEWIQTLGSIITARRKTKPDQYVVASGTMKLIGLGNFDYNIDVTAKNFYFQSDAYDVSGLADVKVKILGEKVPTVRGSISLIRLDVRDEFDRFVTPEYNPNIVLEDSTLWNLDLAISAPNNIWINNTDMDAEFRADVHVERQLGILTILGELDVIRGTDKIIGQRFQFVSGSMLFNNVSVVNPDLNFVVSTKVRNPAAPTEAPSPIELNITGTLQAPQIGVSSSSKTQVSKETLLQYLVSGSQVNPLSGGSGLSIPQQNLLQSLSSTVPTFIPGLHGGKLFEEFDIYPTQGGAQLSLAKYLSRSLSISYSQTITNSSQAGKTIGVQYYLNNNVSLNVSQGGQTTQGKYEGISFDLNLNFEY